jgi:plastocyanin
MSRDVCGRGDLRARRPGLLLCVVLALGCNQDGGAAPRDVVRLDEREVELPAGARRHDVQLHGVGASEEVDPASVDANVGDAIAFNAADGITHSVVFLADRLDSAQVTFLEQSGQMRGPPLLTEGGSWIVSLDGAPPGDYAFACAMHGGQGVIHVVAARS